MLILHLTYARFDMCFEKVCFVSIFMYGPNMVKLLNDYSILLLYG